MTVRTPLLLTDDDDESRVSRTPWCGWQQWRLACAGRIPAEALPTQDREDLIVGLHERGLTDGEIAERTKLSTYTVDRIRTRVWLRERGWLTRDGAVVS